MSKTGKCGHCGYEPVAMRAKVCPKCHGKDPILAGASLGDWGKGFGTTGLILVVGAAVLIGLIAVFGFPN